ncbi:MAG: peptidoglycan-associated lipoprotein Pal [Robiginitomaculum sp.]|nr:peptidoglycan-associated lipoprotein Pal [Robiginitomaculum sp.]
MNIKLLMISAVVVTISACASTPEPAPVKQVQEQAPPQVFEPEPEAQITQEVVEAPIEAIPSGPIPGTSEHFKYVSGDDRVYFGYNKYDLTQQAREVLRSQANWLGQYSNAIIVVGGNADERGTREYNLALGARRADAVKAFLVSQGVAPGRITTVSYGKERPIDGGSNEQAWAMNRNAHSAVLVGGGTS